MGRDEDVVLLHEVPRVLVGRAADADGHRRDERARVVEGLHGGHEALLRDVALLAAEEVLLRHAAVLEDELRGLARAEAHLVLDLADREPRRPLLHDERAVAGAPQRGIDRREDDVPRRARAVRDVALAPVEDPVLAVLAAARADAGDVAPGARLGERVGAPAELLAHVVEDRRRSASSARACRSRAPAGRRAPGPGRQRAARRRPTRAPPAPRIVVTRDLTLLRFRSVSLDGRAVGRVGPHVTVPPRPASPGHGHDAAQEVFGHAVLAVPLERGSGRIDRLGEAGGSSPEVSAGGW